MMSNKEGPSSSGVESYRHRLRVKSNVDYTYKKRENRYINPFATVIQEKKPKVRHVRTTKNVSQPTSKRKMSYINPFAVKSKKRKVELYQSRPRNDDDKSCNEGKSSAEIATVVKREENLPYSLRARKMFNYSLIKRRAKCVEPSTNHLKTEKKDDYPIISESTKDSKCSLKNRGLSRIMAVSEVDRALNKSMTTDSTSIESECARNEVLHIEEYPHSVGSDNLDEKSSIIKIKTESSEDGNRAVSKPLIHQDGLSRFAIDSPAAESYDGASDSDVQFIPKPVQIIIVDDDDDDDNDNNEVKFETKPDESSTNYLSIPPEVSHVAFKIDVSLSQANLEPYELKEEPEESVQNNNLFVMEGKSEIIDCKWDIAKMADCLESLFRDRNTLEEMNFNLVNNNYVKRCAWELENKYRQYEIYSYDGVNNEVGGIEELTEEQLEHPYYKNYHPEPELSEYEKEQIELEKDRICEEASGFNNHLWRRPLNGGPFAQTDETPIPKCPEFIHAFTPAGQHVAMKTDADRPPKFRTDWDRRLWDFATIFNFNRYREDIEEGFYLPESADRQLEKSIIQLIKALKFYLKNKTIPHPIPFEKMLLLNELKFLYWDKCIKTCLPHLEKLALSLLDEILQSPVYIFTLIKYAFVFVTIKKVMLQKRYPELRSKAILLYEKIKDIAILRGGETLEEHIFARAKLLHKHYQSASIFDLLRLNSRTATQSIKKMLNDRLEGKEEEETNSYQVGEEIPQARVEGDNVIDTDTDDDDDDDDDDNDSDTSDDEDDDDSDEDDEDDDDDDNDDDNNEDDEIEDDSVLHSRMTFYNDPDNVESIDEDSNVDSSSSSSSDDEESSVDEIIREE